MNLQSPEPLQVTLEPNDSHQLATLCGPLDAHLKQIEKRPGITINNRGNDFQLIGERDVACAAGESLKQLYREVTGGAALTPVIAHLFMQESGVEALLDASAEDYKPLRPRPQRIQQRGDTQSEGKHLHAAHTEATAQTRDHVTMARA